MRKLSLEKKATYVALLILLVVVAIIRFHFLDLPFERDEGLYAHFASLILDGGLPYQAFYDPKPPGLFYSYAFIMAVFGKTDAGLHIGFLLINLATILFIFYSAKNLWGNITALAVSACFAMLSLSPHAGGLSVLSEHLVMFWVCSGIYLLIKATHDSSTKLLYLSGLAFGFSLFVKQNGIFFIAAGGLYALYYLKWEEYQSWLTTLKKVLIFGIFALLPTLLLYFYLAANGLASDYYYWAIKYPTYLQDVPISEGWLLLKATMPNLIKGHWEWWLLALGGVTCLFFSMRRYINVLVGLLALFSLLSILPRFTFHGHYFLFLFPALSFLVGMLFHEARIWFQAKKGSIVSSPVIYGVVLVLLGIHLYSERQTYFKPDHTALMKEIYGTNPFVESKTIAEHIKRLANDGDQMVVYGGEMQLYFYTGLKAPTKHLFGPYLVDGTPEQNQRQQAFINDIETAMPRFFVAVNHTLTWVTKVDAAQQKVFQWYGDFTNNYKLIGVADIYHGQPTQYHWGDDLGNKKLEGDYNIFVWERADSK